jgi:hypothetical protein
LGTESKKKETKMILAAVWVLGGSGLIFLLVYKRTGQKLYGVLGQSLLICSFGVISVSLIHAQKLLVGIAFGISALGQVFAMVRSRYRKAHPLDGSTKKE